MKLYRTLGAVLALCLLCTAITACGGGEETDTTGSDTVSSQDTVAPATSLTKSAVEIADAVRAEVEFTDAVFVTSDDVDADLTLMFSYGIEEDAQIEAIEDYVLSTLGGKDYPYYFAVIRCKDGTDEATVASIAETVRTSYPATVIAYMAQYNGAWSEVAENFTLMTYDNGIIVTAYDNEGNEEILSLVDSACAQ